MDPYQTPHADLSNPAQRPFRPVKAVVYGLCIAILGVMFASVIVTIAFGVEQGVDFSDVDAVETVLANSTGFMITDLIVSASLFYLAGRVVGRQVPGRELTYGIIVTLIASGIYLSLLIDAETFSRYPAWYNFFSVLFFFLVLPIAARSVAKQ